MWDGIFISDIIIIDMIINIIIINMIINFIIIDMILNNIIIPVKIGRSKLCARDLADKVDACQGDTQIVNDHDGNDGDDDDLDGDVEDGNANDYVYFVVVAMLVTLWYFQGTAGVPSWPRGLLLME